MFKRNIFLIFFILTIDIVVGTLMGTFVPVFTRDSQNPVLYTSLAFTFFTFSQMISAPFLGKISDFLGRKPVVIANSIGTILAQSFLWPIGTLGLLANRLSDGFTNGVYSTTRSMLSDSVPSREVQRYMGFAETISSFGIIAGPALAAVIILFTGEDIIFQTQTVIGVATILAVINLIAVWLLKETLDKSRVRNLEKKELFALIKAALNPTTTIRSIYQLVQYEPKIGLILLTQFLVVCAVGYYQYFIVFAGVGPLQMLPIDLTRFMLYAGAIVAIVNVLYFGVFIKKIDSRISIMLSLLALPVITFLYAFVGSSVFNLYVLITFDLLFSSYLFGLLSGALAQAIPLDRTGEIFGLSQAAASLGAFCTAAMFTLLSSIRVELPFVWFSLCFVGAALVYRRWLKVSAAAPIQAEPNLQQALN